MVKYGLYIHGSRIMHEILTRQKPMETRTHKRLYNLIGEQIALIQTGNGKRLLSGYATISGVVRMNQNTFPDFFPLHRIESGSRWNIKPGQIKYGYILSDVKPLEKPIPLPKKPGSRMLYAFDEKAGDRM